jgi:ELWxxDGT repeat protein
VTTASFPAVNNTSVRTFPVATVNGKLLVQTLPDFPGAPPLSVSDGTGANTTPLNTPALGYTAPVTVIGSKAYFTAANANGGFDPWVTDGTQAGTKLIGPIGMTPYSGIPIVFPREHLVIGQSLFFPAVDSAAGAELFVMTNNAPVAAADTATSDKDAAVTIHLLANDTDSDGSLNAATIQITTNPTHGSVTIGTGGSVMYTPTAGYSGQDTFAYTVADNQGVVSAPAQVTVTVTPAVTVSTGGESGSKGGGGTVELRRPAALPTLVVRPFRIPPSLRRCRWRRLSRAVRGRDSRALWLRPRGVAPEEPTWQPTVVNRFDAPGKQVGRFVVESRGRRLRTSRRRYISA